MATLQDLSTKRDELNTAIANYKQAVQDLKDATITQAQFDAIKADAHQKGDEYAKLTGQVKQDDPNVTNDDQLFSNPSVQSTPIRDSVATIMRTGSLLGGAMKFLVDTEGTTAGATNVVLSFDTGSDITVDWGDGSPAQTYTGAASHDYATSGQYEVRIEGTVNGFTLPNNANKRQIVDVLQWGEVTFASATNMFRNRNNFTISAPDGPKFLPGCSCAYMFYGASTFNSPIGHWDMSNVVDMTSIFINASAFNQPLNSWDVGNVTSMQGMFYQANAFNQPLNSWNVISVTSMYQMFQNNPNFNQPLDQWDVSNVTNMASMFRNADSFSQNLSGWDVSSVTSYAGFADFADLYENQTSLHPNFGA